MLVGLHLSQSFLDLLDDLVAVLWVSQKLEEVQGIREGQLALLVILGFNVNWGRLTVALTSLDLH